MAHTMTSTEPQVRVSLRLPENLLRWFQKRAIKHRRSLNAELIILLEEMREQQATRRAAAPVTPED